MPPTQSERQTTAPRRVGWTWRGPALLAVAYVVFGVTYIYVSGRVVAGMASAVEDLAALEQFKGFLFVLANGVALFSAALIYRRRLERTRAALEGERAVVARFERHLDALHDGLPSALLVVEVMGKGKLRVKRTNPALARLLAVPREQIEVGDTKPIEQALGPTRWAQISRDIYTSAVDRRPIAREYAVDVDGTETFYLQHAVPLLDDAGSVECVFVSLTDTSSLHTSERKRIELEEELLRSQRLLTMGELASGVAHDVNNLLTVIATHTDLLQRELHGRPELERSLTVIDSAVDKASGISRSLLGFSRKMRSQPQVIEVVPLVKDIVELLEHTLTKSYRLELDLGAADGLSIDCDRVQVQQVLMNLILNARDAMPGGGSIAVRAEVVHGKAPRVRLRVDDSGHGVSKDIRERVFEPFFTTKDEGRGSGLGLSLSRRIAREHGGDVTLAPLEGGGTAATLELPVTRAGSASLAPANRDGQWVVLVEAHAQVRAILTGELNDLGFRVESAERADQVTRHMQREPLQPSLVIIDQPSLRASLSTLDDLRAHGAQQAVLLMTLEEPNADVIRPLGPVQVLRKPFGVAEFGRAVRDALEVTGVPG